MSSAVCLFPVAKSSEKSGENYGLWLGLGSLCRSGVSANADAMDALGLLVTAEMMRIANWIVLKLVYHSHYVTTIISSPSFITRTKQRHYSMPLRVVNKVSKRGIGPSGSRG